MEIGTPINKLRDSKEITLMNLSEGIMSVSFLSKFERNETNISFTNLINLLDKLNVGIDEYIELLDYEVPYKKLLKDINIAYKQNNSVALKQLYKRELANFKNTLLKSHYYNSIMIKSIILDIDKSFTPLSQEEKLAISDFFMSVAFLGEYEISLFGNSLTSLENQVILVILNEIQKKINSQNVASNVRIKLIHIVINILIISFEKKEEMEYMEYLIELLNKLIGKNNFYYEILKMKFIEGLYMYNFKNKLKGKEILKKSIDTMKFLGDETGAQNHIAYLIEKINLDLTMDNN